MSAGRITALLLLVLLIAAAWLGPVGAYVDLVGARADEVAERAMLLQRYRALAALPPAAISDAGSADTAMLPPAPEAQAVALLQETVKSAAGASKVRIDSLQVLRSETFSGALKIGVRVRAVGDSAGIARLLFAIEAARPVLLPDNLQIQARTPPGMLDLLLEVSAYAPRSAS